MSWQSRVGSLGNIRMDGSKAAPHLSFTVEVTTYHMDDREYNGSWGSTVACILGTNDTRLSEEQKGHDRHV
jgi:hypothetical protein